MIVHSMNVYHVYAFQNRPAWEASGSDGVYAVYADAEPAVRPRQPVRSAAASQPSPPPMSPLPADQVVQRIVGLAARRLASCTIEKDRLGDVRAVCGDRTLVIAGNASRHFRHEPDTTTTVTAAAPVRRFAGPILRADTGPMHIPALTGFSLMLAALSMFAASRATG